MLTKRDMARLKGVNPDLVRVIKRASTASKVPFMVVEGLRTMERQRQLLRAGATKILNSRHITGHAVDLVPLIDGKPTWHWPTYRKLAPYVWAAAKAEKVPLEWGGDWKNFPDAPHWQLPRRKPYV